MVFDLGFNSLSSLVMFLFALIYIINILISVWIYRDCIQRGKSQEYAILALIASLVVPILAFIVYLLIRKDPVIPYDQD